MTTQGAEPIVEIVEFLRGLAGSDRAGGDGAAARAVWWLPIRHHSPACAHHVRATIARLRPKAILVEGPRDATHFIPLLASPKLVTPVAIFTVAGRSADGRGGAGAYYPLCDYSPELVALRTARELSLPARFIDCTFAEQLACERGHDPDDARETPAAPSTPRPSVRSLQDDGALRRGAWLRTACAAARVRDPDELWDRLFEHDYEHRDGDQFFRNVLAWCAACRFDHGPAELERDGMLVRERVMRAEVDAAVREYGSPIVAVVGGVHAVALLTTVAGPPPSVPAKVREGEQIALMRYDFEQLDRLNGYASGMPSPEFHQRRWEGRDAAELIVECARALRAERRGGSAAEAAEATALAARLAAFPGHIHPTRRDVLDAVLSTFVKGDADVEGALVLATARRVLVGSRIGVLPPEAGRAPIVLDFERLTDALRLPRRGTATPVDLDVHRSPRHLAASRLLHALAILEVPFGEPREPHGRERLIERWECTWHPGVESALIERSIFGATVLEAAGARLVARFGEVRRGAAPARGVAKMLVLGARAGLRGAVERCLDSARDAIAHDADLASVVDCADRLFEAVTARSIVVEGSTDAFRSLAQAAWRRAAYLVPSVSCAAPDAEEESLIALTTWSALAESIADPSADDLRRERLAELADGPSSNALLAGAAHGLLYDDGLRDGASLGRALAGRCLGDARRGAGFLRGVIRASRGACWQEQAVVGALHSMLGELDEATFTGALPHLRLAFAELTPRGIDRVAESVAGLLHIEALPIRGDRSVSAEEVVVAARAELLVADACAAFDAAWDPPSAADAPALEATP